MELVKTSRPLFSLGEPQAQCRIFSFEVPCGASDRAAYARIIRTAMGISDQTLNFLKRAIDRSDVDVGALRMAELGAQHMNVDGLFQGPAKNYFEFLGVEYTSFDLDAQYGAEYLDLGVAISDDSRHLRAFDLVTNFGTSEHVVAHYACPENIHRMCRTGGLMLHAVPPPTTGLITTATTIPPRSSKNSPGSTTTS